MSYEDNTEGSGLRGYWLGKIDAEEEAHKKWRDEAKDAEKAYRDRDKKIEFPIFWSTVQVMLGAIYAREPKPDVRKRNSTDPKSADNIALAIERAIAFYQDTEGFFGQFRKAVEDFGVTALGQAKVELVTETEEIPVIDPMTMEPLVMEDKPVTETQISRQAVRVRHWPWSRFRWEPVASWDRCTWVSFDHVMTKEEIEKEFGVKIERDNAEPDKNAKTSQQKYGPTYVVHEIWDKVTGRRIFVSECHKNELEVGEVPLKLDGFYPCAEPMLFGVASDDLLPQPEWLKIKTQCENIDTLSKRISALAKGIKDVGFYDQSFTELAQLEAAPDGAMFPVKNLMDRLATSGTGRASFDSVVANADNRAKAEVLSVLMDQRQRAKDELFETVGLADIVRGASQASETATAQQIKGQWANVRIGPKVRAAEVFTRDTLRIVAEVICEHIVPDELQRVSGVQLTPDEYEALKGSQRVYTVDIETDATLAQDEQAEKAQRLEVLKTATEYLNSMLPAVQQNVIPADVAKEFVLFAIGSFKYGRQLQDVISQLPGQQQQLQQAQQQVQQLQQQLQQAQQQLAPFKQGEEAIMQADAREKNAKAAKIESEMMQPAQEVVEGPDPADQNLKAAQAFKAQAEGVKTQVETALLPQKMQQDAEIKREGNALRAQNRSQIRPV